MREKDEQMKAIEIRALSDDQIKEKLLDLRKEQLNLRFQSATGQVEKTHRAGEIRNEIARLKTIKTERANQVTAGGK